MKREAVAGCLLVLLVCSVEGVAQSSGVPLPLQAELVKQLEFRHLASGVTVRARVTVDWSGPSCVLRRGAGLEGTIEAVQARTFGTPSAVSLAFRRAQCNGGDLTPISLVVVALAQAPEDLQAAPGIRFEGPAGPFAGGEGAIAGGPAVSDMHLPRTQLATSAHRFPAKAEVHNGDVLNIKGLKLSAGTGPNRSSVLTAERGDVKLRQYTQMLLVPESLMFAPRQGVPVSPAPTQTQDAPGAQSPSGTPPPE